MAGFISEWWPTSNRNGGRHQIGIPGRIESEFASEHSYGFRPGRSAQQAVAQAQRYIAEGYNVVVDLDLEKFLESASYCPQGY